MMARKKDNTNRADEARTNRHQHVRKSTRHVSEGNNAQKRHRPPVMARTGSYDSQSLIRKKTKKPTLKRRFDISLAKAGSQGVEMRLPSVPVVHPGWRFFSFLLVLGSVLVLNYLLTSPVFKVKSVQVEGLLRLSVEEITRSLGVINETIFYLNPEDLELSLADSYVELTNVSILMNLPAQILVRVNERVPMVAWITDDETHWIDGNGYIFPPRGEAEKMVSIYANTSPPVILIDQSGSEESLEEEEIIPAIMPQTYIDAIFVLKTQAPEGTTLMFDAEHGFGWADPRGWRVYFGKNIENIDSKLHVYRAVVKKLEGEGITPNLISVAFLHAPYYR